MKTIAHLIIVNLFASGIAKAQTTITLQPTPAQGKDAMIYSCVPCGYDNMNYGNKKDFDAIAWTNSGNFTSTRSLIQFDLSSVPANALITDARLSFYYNSTSAEGVHSGTNASYLQRITAPWYENTVTWNNQPPTTTANQVLLATSSSNTQNYLNINVTSFICDMVAHPGTNYGFMLKLVNETVFKKLILASSDHVTPSMRPKLDITYTTPLPVSLVSFNVKPAENSNIIKWSTASETNCARFDIERSDIKEVKFESVGSVAGHGSTSQMQNYEFSDSYLLSNKSYLYRLRQVDFDGRCNYSEIIQSSPLASSFVLKLGPNPFRESTTLNYQLESNSTVKAELVDMTGKYQAILNEENQSKGYHEIAVDPLTLGLNAGIYFVRFTVNNEIYTRRIIFTPGSN